MFYPVCKVTVFFFCFRCLFPFSLFRSLSLFSTTQKTPHRHTSTHTPGELTCRPWRSLAAKQLWLPEVSVTFCSLFQFHFENISFGFTLPSVVVSQMLMFNMREDYCHKGGLENWLWKGQETHLAWHPPHPLRASSVRLKVCCVNFCLWSLCVDATDYILLLPINCKFSRKDFRWWSWDI